MNMAKVGERYKLTSKITKPDGSVQNIEHGVIEVVEVDNGWFSGPKQILVVGEEKAKKIREQSQSYYNTQQRLRAASNPIPTAPYNLEGMGVMEYKLTPVLRSGGKRKTLRRTIRRRKSLRRR